MDGLEKMSLLISPGPPWLLMWGWGVMYTCIYTVDVCIYRGLCHAVLHDYRLDEVHHVRHTCMRATYGRGPACRSSFSPPCHFVSSPAEKDDHILFQAALELAGTLCPPRREHLEIPLRSELRTTLYKRVRRRLGAS